MMSNKTIKIHLKIIKEKLINVKEQLEIIKEVPNETGFIAYLKDSSIVNLNIAKSHVNHVAGKLERGKDMKYKYVKYHANYDLTLDKVYEGFKYKEGWIFVRCNDRGGNTLYREECFMKIGEEHEK